MKRSPPDSITQKVRRIFGRGMLEGVRVAGIPNPEEFLMNQKRMRSVVAGLNGVATIYATEVQKAQLETAAQLGFALAIRHWSTSTYHVHAIKPEVL